jgi:hypothetical protein
MTDSKGCNITSNSNFPHMNGCVRNIVTCDGNADSNSVYSGIHGKFSQNIKIARGGGSDFTAAALFRFREPDRIIR